MSVKLIGFDGTLKSIPDGSNGQVLSTDGAGNVAFQDVTSVSFFTFGLSSSQRDITSAVDLQGAGGTTIFSFPSDCQIVGGSAVCNVTSHTSGRSIRFYIVKNGTDEEFVQISPSGTGIAINTATFTPITYSSGDAVGVNIAHSGLGETTEEHSITLQIEI